MATWRITAPRKLGRVEKGQSFIVVTRTTGDPNNKDIEEVLYTNGYKESGGSSAISYSAPGNWKCEKISDDTYPAWNEQHKKYEDEINKDKESAQLEKEKASKRQKDETNAHEARRKAKKEGGSSCGWCSICKCIWKILTCLC